MVIVAPKKMLIRLVLLHLLTFIIIGLLSSISLIDEEINLSAKTYSIRINFLIPVDQEKFNQSLTWTSEFPKQKPKYTVSWINKSTAEIKFWDIKYPQGQEITLKVNKAKTLVPLINKNETIRFRLPIEPEVIRFNTEQYISTLKPIMITFNVPMEAEGIEQKINIINLETGVKVKGAVKPVSEIINGTKYENYSRWIFQPEAELNHNKQYEVAVEPGIVSKAGIKLKSSYNKIITVAPKPKITETRPRNREENVPLYPEIELTASETLKRAKVKLTRQGKNTADNIKGSVSVEENKIFFTPEVALLPNSKYNLEVVGYSIHNEPTEKMTFSFTTIDMGDNYWVNVKLGEIHTVTVYRGQLVLRHMVASGGKEDSKTPLGTYYTGDKGYSFWSPRFGEGAIYWVRLVGQILIHSVPRGITGDLKEAEHSKLGLPASHGCIRLDDKDAKWVFNNIPYGTPVIIHK